MDKEDCDVSCDLCALDGNQEIMPSLNDEGTGGQCCWPYT